MTEKITSKLNWRSEGL